MSTIPSEAAPIARPAARDADAGPPLIVLEAGRAERNYWRDLWRYRELFMILAWRDMAVRYKQTLIGVAWAVIRPLLTVLIFTLFGKVTRLPSEGVAPYAVMVMAGLLPWTLFSTVLSEASASLVNSANLIGKVYFPRIIVPCAATGVALADTLVSLGLMFAMMAFYGYWPDWRVVYLPLFLILAVLASLGPALLLTAMNVKYRDFRFIIPFILQFGLYATPVAYSSSIVPERWRLLYNLNPAVGVIDGFRWSLLRGQADLTAPHLVLNLSVVAFFLVAGVAYFRRTERTFADLL